ncbi:MAG: hypothetical protein M1503_10130 [Thaumarchaeota archaeon]|nr:hypothetical protein [Nitrososphaerota archaeon]MCL5318599.1 hypothetical protein [Nitrososphaerota archaeon]
MGLTMETIRKVESEATLYSDTAVSANDVHDWATQKTKTVTLKSQTLIGVYFTAKIGVPGSGLIGKGGARVLLDDVPLVTLRGTVQQPYAGDYSVGSRGVLLILAAGTYTFKIQTSLTSAGDTSMHIHIDPIIMGSFDLPDDTAFDQDSGNTSITTVTEQTLVTLNIPVPAKRTTILGDLRKYTCIVTVYAEHQNSRTTKMKNTGESNEASFFNCKLFIDGVQVDWASSESDYENTDNPTFGEGAYGRYTCNFAENTFHNIKIKIYNGYGTDQTGRVRATAILCPWLFGTDSEPVNFGFPQGSTVYLMAEPLFENPTKSIKLGRKRGVTFGDAADFFSTSTGADRTSFNYTFEMVQPAVAQFYLTGIGVCITSIGVDLR